MYSYLGFRIRISPVRVETRALEGLGRASNATQAPAGSLAAKAPKHSQHLLRTTSTSLQMMSSVVSLLSYLGLCIVINYT